MMATVSRWFMKRRALALGILTAGIACGMMIMPPIIQTLITSQGWRTTMVILGITVLVIYSITALLTRKNPQEMGLLPYGSTLDDNKDAEDTDVVAPAVTPQRRDSTLKEAIRNRDLWLLWAMFGTLSVSVMMVTTHVVRYAQDTGIPPARAALIVSIIGAGGMVGKILGGAASERIGARRIIIICAATLAVTMVWLTTPMSMWTFFAFAVPFGMAYGGWVPNISVLIADIFGITHYGKLWATVQVGGGLGGLVGPILAGYVFDTTGSYRIAFLSGAGISLLTIVSTLLLSKRNERPIVTKS
jgi:MFS family permease